MKSKTILVIGTATRGQYQHLRDEVFATGCRPIIFRVMTEKINFLDHHDPDLRPDQSIEMNDVSGEQQGSSEYVYEIDATIRAMGDIQAIMIDHELWSQSIARQWRVSGDTYGDYLLYRLGAVIGSDFDCSVHILSNDGSVQVLDSLYQRWP